MVAKDPAYPMYAQDFDMDTADWGIDEIGIYIRLLNYEWINGYIPSDPSRIAKIARISVKKLLKSWEIISPKFSQKCDDKLQNRRMEEERKKRSEYLEKQRSSGMAGIEKKKREGIFPFNKSSDPSSDPSSQNQALQSSSSTSPTKIKDIARFNNEDFEKFYSEYPVHTGKTPALEKWKRKLKDGSLPELNVLLSAIEKQKAWRVNATEFRPAWKNPATWLHQETWIDEQTEYGGNNGTGKQYDRKDKNWNDREMDAETERLNQQFRTHQAKKAAGNTP